MRHRISIVATMSGLLALASVSPAQTQEKQQHQAVPDAPQPQKKAEHPPTTPDSPKKEPAGKDDNAFPEDASRAAAAKTQQEENTSKDQAPEDSRSAGHSSSQDNPFPEDTSRDAAKAAGTDPSAPTPSRPDLPPGVSSSQSSSSLEGTGNGQPMLDPARAQKDTDVGGFYYKTGNFHGALQRFKDASAADPTNVEAIFGLAEAERMLGQTAEAARNYQLYLDIVPNGPKAKQSIKAIKTLQAAK